jgi:rfaE bifunctional protein nucleotidyltransferase chain/domain
MDLLVLNHEAELTAVELAALPRPIIFTNGVFDILHRGHVEYLNAASKLGATLIVGVNTDASVRMLGKGEDRPINNEMDRAYLISALRAVGAVVLFEERTPVQLISSLRPDIYVKGGDYDVETLEETFLVRSWGGRSLALPFCNGYSTSSLIATITKTQ